MIERLEAGANRVKVFRSDGSVGTLPGMAFRPKRPQWMDGDSRERSRLAYAPLADARVYGAMQRSLGADRIHRLLVDRCIRPDAGMTVVDVGAGTGTMRGHLADCNYIAVEPNPSYASVLRSRFAADDRVQVVEDTSAALSRLDVCADRVLFVGILHHLSDEAAAKALADAGAILHVGGRVITLDPCRHAGQSRAAAFLVGRDRGANVREASAYGALAVDSFKTVRLAITDGLLPVPYSHCWMECEGPHSRCAT